MPAVKVDPARVREFADAASFYRWLGENHDREPEVWIRLHKKASGLVKYLLNNRKHATYWTSTRDTAVAVESFADYIRASGEQTPEMTVVISGHGRPGRTGAAGRRHVRQAPLRLGTLPAVHAGREELVIVHRPTPFSKFDLSRIR